MGIARSAALDGFISLETTSAHCFLSTLQKNKPFLINNNLLNCPFSLKNEGAVVRNGK